MRPDKSVLTLLGTITRMKNNKTIQLTVFIIIVFRKINSVCISRINSLPYQLSYVIIIIGITVSLVIVLAMADYSLVG